MTQSISDKQRYNLRRELLINAGQWAPFVDAEPVRRHVNELRAAGLGKRRIAALSGVSNATIQHLLRGNPGSGRPRTARIRPDIARALLAVRPGLDTLADSAAVDTIGTRRRVQALMCLGWSQREQADRVGIDQRTFSAINTYDRIAASTARAVRDLYDELSMTVAPSSQGSNYARTYAKKRGYAPPLAWDDDSIDDPKARPDFGKKTGVHAAIQENVSELTAQRVSDEEIARRLGISRDWVVEMRRRARKAVAA
jgi:transcriptional regulator